MFVSQSQWPGLAIPIPREGLASLCKRWGITKVELFGSALRADFDSVRSDIDVLVTFAPGALPGWDFFGRLPEDLRQLFGRTVDVTQRSAVEQSSNWIRKKQILESAVPIYESVG